MDNPEEEENILESLEAKWMVDGEQRFRYKGFWFKPDFIYASEASKTHFTPLPSDIILGSFPKTGTTWLKALTSSILRHSSTSSSSVHLDDDLNPHEVVPFLEIEMFGENPSKDCQVLRLQTADTFVSLWHLYQIKFRKEISIRAAFEEFCNGFVPAGPYFDHVLEFWKAKDFVMFITYEDLKANPKENVRKIAKFLGCLSGGESHQETMVEEIVRECSFESLRNTSKDDTKETHWSGNKYEMFFRKGMVGDWKNHLTQDMMKALEDMAELNWRGCGLDISIFNSNASQC